MFDEEFDENEETDEEFQADPGVVAYLDQEGAAFASAREEFQDVYGFDHDCACAQDYAEGRVATVTECYLGMVDDALETCARLNWENKTLQGMLSVMLEANNNLMDDVEDADENLFEVMSQYGGFDDIDEQIEAEAVAELLAEEGIIEDADA